MAAAGIPRANAPGVAYEYSNYGFALLGRIVARASGMRYRDYVDAQLLAPLIRFRAIRAEGGVLRLGALDAPLQRFGRLALDGAQPHQRTPKTLARGAAP